MINQTVEIGDEELVFSASRSAGPGGQNVNKVNSRVTLSFDLEASPSLTPEQKELIRQRLAGRINKKGIFQVSCQEERGQAANRKLAQERFVFLLENALKVNPKRRPTRQPKWVSRKRLQEKRRRGQIKKGRMTKDFRSED